MCVQTVSQHVLILRRRLASLYGAGFSSLMINKHFIFYILPYHIKQASEFLTHLFHISSLVINIIFLLFLKINTYYYYYYYYITKKTIVIKLVIYYLYNCFFYECKN